MEKDIERPSVSIRNVLLGVLVSILLSATCFLLLVHFTGGENALTALAPMGFRAVIYSVLCVGCSWLVDAWKLMVIAQAMGGKFRLWETLKVSIMSAFVAGVTPFDTGGEPLRIYYLHKGGMSLGESTAVVALGALLHSTTRLLLWLFVPVVMFLSGITWHFSTPMQVTLCIGLGFYLLLLGVILVSTFKPQLVVSCLTGFFSKPFVKRIIPSKTVEMIIGKIQTIATDFRDAILKVKDKGAKTSFAVFLSLSYWILVICVPAVLLKGLGSSLSFIHIFSVTMSVYLIMAYVPTPGASGGAEAGSALLFAPLLPGRLLGVFVLAWRILTYYLTLAVGGTVFAAYTISCSIHKVDRS